MKQKTIYTCEKCGYEIENDYEAMLDHEYGHIEPINFQKPQAGFYYQRDIYPRTVKIKMSNGAMVEYREPVEVTPPEQKESPLLAVEDSPVRET